MARALMPGLPRCLPRPRSGLAAIFLGLCAVGVADDRVAPLVENEDTYLELRGVLAEFGRALRVEGVLPCLQTASWSEGARMLGLAEDRPAQGDPVAGGVMSRFSWPTAGVEAVEVEAGGPWAPLLAHTGALEDASFSVEWAQWVAGGEGDGRVFRTEVIFEGRARPDPDGAGVLGIEARQTVLWRRAGGGWEIVEWKQGEMTLTEAPHSLFAEVTRALFVEPQDFERANRSPHGEALLQYFRSGVVHMARREWAPYFEPESTSQFDGVSVVDVDGDGSAEIFIPAHRGRTMLLKRGEDGKWRDIAAASGLQFTHQVNSALFFDMNNNGLPDVFLCRVLEPCMILRNDGGVFVDVTAESEGVGDLFFAVSATAADWNGNGLLDLYVSTYGPPNSDEPEGEWEKTFLREQDLPGLRRAQAKSDRFVRRAGPVNAWFRNDGGRLVRVDEPEEVAQWRNTYQASFADFDGDGRPDLYVCNDYAPDVLLRNVTPQGALEPVFEDVSHLLGPTRQGFGMGVSWADFDGSGRLDLYVTNMFSKAGRRIMGQLGDAREATRLSAEGCFLYRNTEEGLVQEAGTEPGQLAVAAVGWAYSGQFADFTNDGWPDLHVPSGLFTVPGEAATDLDL